MSNQRVVITGLGALSSLGTLEEYWQGLIAGHSGIRPIRSFDASSLKSPIAGELEFDPARYEIPAKNARRMSRSSLMALATAKMTLAHAGISAETIEQESERSGVVIGTANAGFEVLLETALESLEHARARGARIHAEVLGYASSSDAGHSAAPDSEGRGAAKSMLWALQDAECPLDAIGYINAHGTGTQVNDEMETKAIKRVFGERAYRIPVSSTKSMIGHCMGGSGALEAIACVKTLDEGTIHPTINLETPDPACDLDYVPGQARRVEVHATLSNSFGLGGQNTCLVLGAYKTG